VSHDVVHIPARDHATLGFAVPCERCGAFTERRIGPRGTALPASATCGACGTPQRIDLSGHVDEHGALDGCPRCDYHTLCIQKDVNPRLGVALVVITYAAILALRLDLATTIITLVALTAIDAAALKLLVKRLLICYRCKAQFRGFPPGPRCRPFDLATWEAHDPPASR
jgi:hypothetical protein